VWRTIKPIKIKTLFVVKNRILIEDENLANRILGIQPTNRVRDEMSTNELSRYVLD